MCTIGLSFIFLVMVLQGASLRRSNIWELLRTFGAACAIQLIGGIRLALYKRWSTMVKMDDVLTMLTTVLTAVILRQPW